MALSVGALLADRAGGDTRSWLLAAAWSEAADAVAVVAVARHLPPAQRVLALAGPAVLSALAFTLAHGTTA